MRRTLHDYKLLLIFSFTVIRGATIYAEPINLTFQPAKPKSIVDWTCQKLHSVTGFSFKKSNFLSALNQRHVNQVLRRQDDDVIMGTMISSDFKMEGVLIGVNFFYPAIPFKTNTMQSLGMSALTDLMQHPGDPHSVGNRIRHWFEVYLPDYKPVFGAELEREFNQHPSVPGAKYQDGIIIQPLIYAALMNEKKFSISHIHDLTHHLPMLLDPEIKAMVEKHFRVAIKHLHNATKPFPNWYSTLRLNYYEQFIYFEPSSQTVVGLGGIGQFLSSTLLGIHEDLKNPQDTASASALQMYHGTFGQDPNMIKRLLDKVAVIAPRLEEEIPHFSVLSRQKKADLILIYASRAVALDQDLMAYFSKEHQLSLWANALKNFE